MKNLSVLLVALSTATFAQSPDLKNPPQTASLFMEGAASTYLNERDFALSPDGNEIYFTVSTPQSTFQTIVSMRKQKDGKWSTPAVVPFAGKFSDLEPAFSADGNSMFFASNRPVMGTEKKDFDIWQVERKNGAWGEPKNLGQTINTATDEFYPSVAKNGNLYFTATYEGGVGREDIYQAKWTADHFEKPVPLDTGVNSKFYEFNAFVDPDEQFIFFTSYGRKDDTGRGDLYLSKKGATGRWQPAVNLKLINSNRLDYCPAVTPDRKALFFTSERSTLPVSFETPVTYRRVQDVVNSALNGTGNIYWIKLEAVLESAR